MPSYIIKTALCLFIILLFSNAEAEPQCGDFIPVFAKVLSNLGKNPTLYSYGNDQFTNKFMLITAQKPNKIEPNSGFMFVKWSLMELPNPDAPCYI